MIEKLKDFEIYIFDFDGTLINSEPFHKKRIIFEDSSRFGISKAIGHVCGWH